LNFMSNDPRFSGSTSVAAEGQTNSFEIHTRPYRIPPSHVITGGGNTPLPIRLTRMGGPKGAKIRAIMKL